MSELITWLREQIDTDERIARAAGGSRWIYRRSHDRAALNVDHALLTDDRVIDATGYDGELTPAEAEHIALHDPARELAEVAAKRARLAIIEHMLADDAEDEMAQEQSRIEALPYAGREGYRQEWAPREGWWQ